jgi:dodecin
LNREFTSFPEGIMAQVFKSVELVGVSPSSFDEAVRVAVKRAGETTRGLQWLEVLEQRAYLGDGDVREFQVKVRIWFELENGAQ